MLIDQVEQMINFYEEVSSYLVSNTFLKASNSSICNKTKGHGLTKLDHSSHSLALPRQYFCVMIRFNIWKKYTYCLFLDWYFQVSYPVVILTWVYHKIEIESNLFFQRYSF